VAEVISFVLTIAGSVDVVARTSFAIAQLLGEWKEAPTHITSLSQEVKHFHDVTVKLNEFASHLGNGMQTDVYVTALSDLMRRAEPSWAQLEKIVQSLMDSKGHARRQR
jgi:hypothetical protein